jgi:hypothetical protein
LAHALVVLPAALFWTAELRAAVMLSPTSVLGTDMGESDPTAAVGKMIDQSGLDKPFTSGVTDFDAYFTTGDPPFAQAAAGNNWQSEADFSLPVSGFVDFDLGAVRSIDRIAIWNISLKDVTIHVSDTSIGSLQEVASFTLPSHISFPFSYPHDVLDLGGVRAARYVRLEVESVHLFSPSDTFGFAIVGEVVAAEVPEPAAFALAAAIGSIAAMRRPRR